MTLYRLSRLDDLHRRLAISKRAPQPRLDRRSLTPDVG
jgi:hypothetical protein